MPSTALVLAVTHDTGATLTQTLELYKDEADLKEVTDGIDQALGVLGGADGAIGWIGDTGLVVNPAGDLVEGGLVILPTDSTAAGRFFTSVRNLAALGSPIRSRSGTRSTQAPTITIASLDSGRDGRRRPSPVGKIEISWAVTDGLVVIGSGPDFVKHILDTTDATSLASNDRYKGLIEPRRDGDRIHVRGYRRDPQTGRDQAHRRRCRKAQALRDRRQAVPDPVRRAHRVRLGRRRPDDLDPHRHREVGGGVPQHPPRTESRRSNSHMAVRIRLTRVGATKQPSYRVVVADGRNARDGHRSRRSGHYNPRTEPIEFNVDEDKAKAWLAKGAQPSDTVLRLFRQAGIVPAAK